MLVQACDAAKRRLPKERMGRMSRLVVSLLTPSSLSTTNPSLGRPRLPHLDRRGYVRHFTVIDLNCQKAIGREGDLHRLTDTVWPTAASQTLLPEGSSQTPGCARYVPKDYTPHRAKRGQGSGGGSPEEQGSLLIT